MKAGNSTQLPRYGVLLAGEVVFSTADAKQISGVVFGLLVGSGSHKLEAGRNVITMGLHAIKDQVVWTIQTKDGQELKVLPPMLARRDES